MTDIYPIKSGSVDPAVDLIKGIGVYAGLKNIDVEGVTGLYTTNYEGKARAAIEALNTMTLRSFTSKKATKPVT